MKVAEKKWIRFRIYGVAVFFLIGFSTIFARAFQLQVIQKDYLQGTAENGIIGTAQLPPDRGIIYDREGNELAVSVQVGSVFAHPKQIKDKKAAARHLSRILNEKEAGLLKILSSNRSFEWIKRKIPPEQSRQVAALKIDGLGVTTESRRYYPGRETGAHLIGFAGTDNQGLEGLEKKYDGPLKGPPRRIVWMRDALGRPFAIDKPVSSGQGIHHLILTIDKDIQYKAQEALEAAVTKSRATGGHCLVLDPGTGEILAMAVVPVFNPNLFYKCHPDQWRNRVVADCFEPGSTLKAFLVAAALEESVVTPLSEFYCEQGKYKIGGRIVHDTHKYGNLTVSDIVIHSSNIGAIKIGQRLGYAKFCDYLKRFGFSQKTGIDIFGERDGFIRSPKNAKIIDQATVYFGQGITATSLQLAMAMGAIANGGNLMRPFVVKKIVDESGQAVEETRPQVLRRVISVKTAKMVTRILEGVAGSEGTAKGAAIGGYMVAGKTGTSQKVDPATKRYSRSKYVASFVGFVPSDKPRLLISVSIDEPKGMTYGGLVAGPVFKEVGSWALNYLRVNPRPELLTAAADSSVESGLTTPANEREKRPESPEVRELADQLLEGLLPDFKGMGMREVLKRGRSLGLKVSLEGSGLAVAQIPEAGSPIETMDTVTVRFNPPGPS
jgi:cell division protein FtsI (penicillin-binding protein 3)